MTVRGNAWAAGIAAAVLGCVATLAWRREAARARRRVGDRYRPAGRRAGPVPARALMLTAAGIVFLAAAGCSSGPTTASRFGSPSAATSVTLRGPSGQGIQSVAFSPDGNTIATIANSDSSGKIYLWDASRRTLTATLTDPAGQAFLSAAFSPDGKTIA